MANKYILNGLPFTSKRKALLYFRKCYCDFLYDPKPTTKETRFINNLIIELNHNLNIPYSKIDLMMYAIENEPF